MFVSEYANHFLQESVPACKTFGLVDYIQPWHVALLNLYLQLQLELWQGFLLESC